MEDQLDATYPNQELVVLEDKEEVLVEIVDLVEVVVAVEVSILIKLLKKEISMDLLVLRKML